MKTKIKMDVNENEFDFVNKNKKQSYYTFNKVVITIARQTVDESRSSICNTSSEICNPYEECKYNSSYTSGVYCVPGCYQKCTADFQQCVYEGGTTAVCRYTYRKCRYACVLAMRM